MSRLLHLTNGSAIIPLMREAGIDGSIVSWDDVLHEGPVPAGLGPVALRERRAGFLASCGWGSQVQTLRGLEARDLALEQAAAIGGARGRLATVDEIVLWFEHDLYDQLQVVQILERLPVDITPRLTAVPDDTYLGMLSAARYPGLFAARREITSGERVAARDAWDAFRAADPRALVDAIPRVSVMPHLGAALRRHLQQFPALQSGLSRTEQQTLEALTSGPDVIRSVYVRANHEREEAFFMGDSAFLVHIESLFRSPRPLLRRGGKGPLSLDEVIELTDDGRRVLDGALDRIAILGIDRWLGGVQLTGYGPVWRWDAQRAAIRMA